METISLGTIAGVAGIIAFLFALKWMPMSILIPGALVLTLLGGLGSFAESEVAQQTVTTYDNASEGTKELQQAITSNLTEDNFIHQAPGAIKQATSANMFGG